MLTFFGNIRDAIEDGMNHSLPENVAIVAVTKNKKSIDFKLRDEDGIYSIYRISIKRIGG